MTTKSMRVVNLNRYNIELETAINSLEVVQKPIPKPENNQVLIKVEAAPCNPSDLSFLQGAYGVKKKLPVINVIRKESQAKILQKMGGEYVLDLTSKRFIIDLRNIARELNATTAIDAVSGGLAGTIIKAMPEKSQYILFGALSGKAVTNVDARDIIFSRKKIRGFILWEWLNSCSSDEIYQISNYLQELTVKGIINSSIQRIITLDEAVEGINQYKNNMTEGKVIFFPHK